MTLKNNVKVNIVEVVVTFQFDLSYKGTFTTFIPPENLNKQLPGSYLAFDLKLTFSRSRKKLQNIISDVKFSALFESGVRNRGSHFKKPL